MNTLNLTDDQLHQLIDALDEARDEHETSYVEWCSEGNDPTKHIWYRMADASTMLDEVMEESDKASYMYDICTPVSKFVPPKSPEFWDSFRKQADGKDKIMGDVNVPNAAEAA